MDGLVHCGADGRDAFDRSWAACLSDAAVQGREESQAARAGRPWPAAQRAAQQPSVCPRPPGGTDAFCAVLCCGPAWRPVAQSLLACFTECRDLSGAAFEELAVPEAGSEMKRLQSGISALWSPHAGSHYESDESETEMQSSDAEQIPSNMAMKSFLPKMNKIQDLFSSLNYEPIELPKIVVVGTQSAGKTSVLESLVKRSFLPRGPGIVTRCPLVLQLHYCPLGDLRRTGIDYEEWGTFLHAGNRVFSMAEICTEIEDETRRLAGENQGIVKTPITLKVFSPHVVNVTLVDLPGITKVPVGDQPDDVEAQIEKLILEYIMNPLTIILAVVTANTDMVTNDSLKLAKFVDPRGERTLAVVTKIDLMDKGTNAEGILNGLVIPVKLGIVGVINRSQKDIQDDKSMREALAYEKEFFEKYYKEIAFRHGSQYLANKLSRLLSAHIEKSLPFVKECILKEMDECSQNLDMCGDPITDPRTSLMSICNAFCHWFDSLCEKGPRSLQTNNLVGGAKLCDILHNTLDGTIVNVEPCEAYTTDEVIMAIRQSNGLKPPFFFSELAFERLVIPLIKKMEKPALVCVEEVKNELNKMCQMSLPQQLHRFPMLRKALVEVVEELIHERSLKAVHVIRDLVEMEAGHITYYRIHVLKDECLSILTRRSDEEPIIPFKSGEMDKLKMKYVAGNLQGEEREEFARQWRIFKKEENHVMVLGTVLDHYYKIVAQAMQDATAKAIATFLVNGVRAKLIGEMCLKLMKDDQLDDLFQERDDVKEKRQDNIKKLKVLKSSLAVIADFGDH